MHITQSLDLSQIHFLYQDLQVEMIEGKMWCFPECPSCGEIIKAESKMKLKLVFQNHYCEDNHRDKLVLPEVKEITRVQTDWCY